MDTRTYRATLGAYAVFGTIAGALSVLWLVAVWRTGAPWLPLAVPLVGYALVALWLSRFRITLSHDVIEVGAPFLGGRTLERRDVLSIEFAEEPTRGEGTMTLCIRTSDGAELRLNAKVFSTEAIQHLLAIGSQASAQSKKPRWSPAPR